MGRIVAILAVIALLFSVGSAWADDNSEANKLFVEAVKLVNSAEDLKRGSEGKAVALEEALRKLNEIIDDHPSSDLAVKLITNQDIGDTSLRGVRYSAESAREKADKRAEKEREKAREFAATLGAAVQGSVTAMRSVGRNYVRGYGVPQNAAEGFKWYRKAAERGNSDAMHTVGGMYFRGDGIPENKAEAIKWLRKAAKLGHKSAKRALKKLEAK